MQVLRDHTSPNHDQRRIAVEFVVLHYTACSLSRTLELFTDRGSGVSAHLVIGEEGEIAELVPCLEGTAARAWHAGHSRWHDGSRLWQGFNDFSVGIELVNLNGNLLPFPPAQLASLERVMSELKGHYPALASPHRVVGHEHIAGWRGKADPGALFDWQRFFATVYPGGEAPPRAPVCPAELRSGLLPLLDFLPRDAKARDSFASTLSQLTETCVRLVR